MSQLLEQKINNSELQPKQQFDLSKVAIDHISSPYPRFHYKEIIDDSTESECRIGVATTSDTIGDDSDTSSATAFSINAQGDLNWTVGEKIEIIIIRGKAGDVTELGAYGTENGIIQDLTALDEVYIISKEFATIIKSVGPLNKDAFDTVMTSDEIKADVVRVTFNDALTMDTISDEMDDSRAEHRAVTTSAAERRLNKKRVSQSRLAARKVEDVQEYDDGSSIDIMQAFRDDKELQSQIEEAENYTDEHRGFAINDKRKRSREELLYMPLDELDASIRRAAPKPPLPDHTPTNHLDVVDAPKPPLPDHTPTNHLNAVDTLDSASGKMSWKEKMRSPLAYLAAKLASERMIRQNKREAQGLPRERFDSDKREKGLKIALGAVGVALVAIAAYKLGELQTDPINLAAKPFDGSERDSSDVIDAAVEHARQVEAQHLEILNSPVNIIPNGGGGEAYTSANGVDASLWYQNQNEFHQQFPDEAYRMSDGNVGFRRPGELSNSAKEYWAKKFGKWL